MKILIAASLIASAGAHAAASEQLWKEWYLISRNGVATGYFEEIADRRPGEKQIAITQRWVENPAERTETYVGSVSEEARLKPVAFYVDRKAPTEEKSYRIDARVKNKKFEITFRPASEALAKSTEITSLKPEMYLSSFVPLAVARNFKSGKPTPFTAVIEDGGEMSVEVKKGSAELTKKEKKIAGQKCIGATIELAGASQNWWITNEGKTCLVEIPSQGVTLALSTENDAKKAFGEKK